MPVHPYARLFFGLAGPTVTEDSDSGYELGDIWIVPGSARYQAIDVSPGAAVWEISSGGPPSWGDILGTLSDQTDLQSALDAKLDDSQLEDTIANGVTTKAPSQNAVFDALALKEDLSNKDTDGTLAANSDLKYPSQKAVKTYADALIAANDALQYKGAIDASANPNYPAASAGHAYKISVAGKIGGASGPNVEVGDLILCTVDGSASGNHATVGANWDIIQVNIDGAVIGPASSTSGNIVTFSGTSGKLIQDGGATIASLGMAPQILAAGSETSLDAADLFGFRQTIGGLLKRIQWGDIYTIIENALNAVFADLGAYNAHTHDNSDTVKLSQANTHQSPDTDAGSSSLHHTIGSGANQSAAGNHQHTAALIFPAHGLNGTIAAGVTVFTPLFFYGLNAGGFVFTVDRAGTLDLLSMWNNTAQPATGSLVVTVMKNGVASALTLTYVNADGVVYKQDTTHTVALAAGDTITIRLVNNALGASAQINGLTLRYKVTTT